MTPDDGRGWRYLSPTQIGWTWVNGVRGVLRGLAVSPSVSPPTEREAASPTVLDAIGQLSWLKQLLEDDILGLVTEAHYRGISWTDIANRLDRSKQSVHQRYFRRVHAPSTHQRLAADVREVAGQVRRYLESGRRSTGDS